MNKQLLSPAPASEVRLSGKILAWFLSGLVLASLGLIFTKIILEPASQPPTQPTEYHQSLVE